jgi:hypothetical protein
MPGSLCLHPASTWLFKPTYNLKSSQRTCVALQNCCRLCHHSRHQQPLHPITRELEHQTWNIMVKNGDSHVANSGYPWHCWLHVNHQS